MDFILGIGFGGLLVAGIYFIVRNIMRQNLRQSLGMSLFLVRIPKENSADSDGKDFKEEINRFEELLGNLSALKRPFVFEMAVHHVGEEIHFYIAVPMKFGETAVKQIQGLW